MYECMRIPREMQRMYTNLMQYMMQVSQYHVAQANYIYIYIYMCVIPELCDAYFWNGCTHT